MRKQFKEALASICLVLIVLTTIACAQNATPAANSNSTPHREVAITFDDLPATYGNNDLQRQTDVTKNLLMRIKANNIPAIGFVIERKLHESGATLDQRIALLRMWLDAGLDLGNHTYSHVAPDGVSLATYEEDVIRGETITKKLLSERGMKLRYFRHPQLKTGPTVEYKQALEKFLAGRGYTIAPVTIDNNDIIFAALYGDAKMRGDKATMKRVADAYVPYMEAIFDFFEKLSVETVGHEVKQTLLLHANDLNADHLDDLVQMMKRRGYTFISLDDALKDKAYSLPDAQFDQGVSWIHRWRLAKGMPLHMEPGEPDFITELFRERQR